MIRVGILSDTHAHWDDRYVTHFSDCDEVWHAGDIGSLEVANKFESFKTFRAVCGNCDGGVLRQKYKEIYRFNIEECSVMMKHIGGYPGKYDASIRREIYTEKPDLFICGHSHILKVKYDGIIDCLHINPGAAGLQGWHQIRTLVKVSISGKSFENLEVIELH